MAVSSSFVKVFAQAELEESIIPIVEGHTIVGRGQDCAAALIPAKGLSRHHVEILVDGSEHFIKDLGSRNKTYRFTHQLRPHVYYELRNNTELHLANVKCLYIVANPEGSLGPDKAAPPVTEGQSVKGTGDQTVALQDSDQSTVDGDDNENQSEKDNVMCRNDIEATQPYFAEDSGEEEEHINGRIEYENTVPYNEEGVSHMHSDDEISSSVHSSPILGGRGPTINRQDIESINSAENLAVRKVHKVSFDPAVCSTGEEDTSDEGDYGSLMAVSSGILDSNTKPMHTSEYPSRSIIPVENTTFEGQTIPVENTTFDDQTIPVENTTFDDQTIPVENTTFDDQTIPVENTTSDDQTIPVENTTFDDQTIPVENTTFEGQTIPVENTTFDDQTIPVENTTSDDQTIPVENTTFDDQTIPVENTTFDDQTIPVENTTFEGQTIPVVDTSFDSAGDKQSTDTKCAGTGSSINRQGESLKQCQEEMPNTDQNTEETLVYDRGNKILEPVELTVAYDIAADEGAEDLEDRKDASSVLFSEQESSLIIDTLPVASMHPDMQGCIDTSSEAIVRSPLVHVHKGSSENTSLQLAIPAVMPTVYHFASKNASELGGPLDQAQNIGGPLDQAQNIGGLLDQAHNIGGPLDQAQNIGGPLDQAQNIGGPLDQVQNIGGPLDQAQNMQPGMEEDDLSDDFSSLIPTRTTGRYSKQKVSTPQRGRGKRTRKEDTSSPKVPSQGKKKADSGERKQQPSLAKNRQGSGKNKQAISETPMKPAKALESEMTFEKDSSLTPPTSSSTPPTSSTCSLSSKGSHTSTKKPSITKATPGKRLKPSLNSEGSSPSLRPKCISEIEKPRVLFTGIVYEAGEKIVRELGGQLVDSVYECTHLVTDKMVRTIKLLCCLSRGCHIVSSRWLDQCQLHGAFLSADGFLLKDRTAERQHNFLLQRSLQQARQVKFLDGYKIFMTPNVTPDRAALSDIIKCSGGQILDVLPTTKDDQTLIVSCDQDLDTCKSAQNVGLVVYTPELILSGALRQELDVVTNILLQPVAQLKGAKRKAEHSEETVTKRRRK